MTGIRLTVLLLISTLVMARVEAAAQTGFPVCETQQQLEQFLQSDGQLMPDGCRRATMVVVESTMGRLCVLDLGQDEAGLVGRLREAATTTRWWMACEQLTPSDGQPRRP